MTFLGIGASCLYWDSNRSLVSDRRAVYHSSFYQTPKLNLKSNHVCHRYRARHTVQRQCNKSSHFVTLDSITTTALSTRRGRAIHPERAGLQQRPREKGSNLPEHLERQEIEAVIASAPNPIAKLLVLEQWRAGLRVSEALARDKALYHGLASSPTADLATNKWLPRFTEQTTKQYNHGQGRVELPLAPDFPHWQPEQTVSRPQ